MPRGKVRDMSRRWSVSLLVLTATLVTVPALALSAPAAFGRSAVVTASPHPVRTLVRHVRPVTSTGALRAGYTITHRHGKASCQAGSEAIGNAYRCFAGNFVYDPCWVAANPKYVICLGQPYSHRVARLRVSKGYENAGGLGSAGTLPWGVQVGSTRATLLQGATGTVNGKRINYSIKGFSVVLIGNVNKKHAQWFIREARRTNGHYHVMGFVAVREAWFGERSRLG
jgi:hypothetical protein